MRDVWVCCRLSSVSCLVLCVVRCSLCVVYWVEPVAAFCASLRLVWCVVCCVLPTASLSVMLCVVLFCFFAMLCDFGGTCIVVCLSAVCVAIRVL